MYGANTDVVEGAKAVRTVSTLSSRCEAIGNSGTHILAYGGNNTSGPIEVATACNTRERFDFETETLIAHTLRGEGFDSSEDGTGRGTPLVIAYMPARSLGKDGVITDHFAEREISDALHTKTGQGNKAPLIVPPQPQSFDWQAGGGGSDKSRTYIHDTPGRTRALTSCKTLAVTVFDSKSTGVQNSEDISPTLRSMNSAQNHPNAGGQLAIAFGWQNSEHQGDSCSESVTPTLDKSKTPAVMASSAVRRLTPKECERLQGFPDNWTWIPEQDRRKIEEDYYAYILRSFPDMSPEEAERLSKDGPRYKALGNAFAVPVVRWIAKRLVAEIKRSEESC